MKWIAVPRFECCRESLPTRGAWIEIAGKIYIGLTEFRSLPTRGAWIEIVKIDAEHISYNGRSPHGERGLK